MSSGVDGYEEDADLRNQQLLMLRQHSHSNVYHVPQHSRREKLRFQPPPSSLLLQDHSPVVLPNLTVSSSSSSSPSSYFSTNPNSSFSVAPALQFVGPARRFSLSLTSPSYSHLRPMLDHDPPQPFTGYAAVLNESRFLEATLQLLQGTCDVGRAAARDGGDGARCHTDCMVLLHHAMEDVADVGRTRNGGSIVGAEQVWKKTKLVSMLDEVYSRYTHYYQQVQSIVRAFESVTGLCTAAPYALMALRTMSKQFRCLANMISDQLHQMNKVFEGASQNEVPGSSNVTGGVCGVRTPIDSSAYQNQPIWRPQRGLPERAVSVLRKWLFEHFLHPYPTDTDKQILAKQTGLSRNQVSNWFINARVRLWKPMVEEIHSLEMRQSHRVSTADRSHSSNEPRQLPPDAPAAYPGEQAVAYDKPWKDHQSSPSEPFRDEITQIGNQIQEPAEFPSNVMPSNHDVGVETGPGRASGGVTLTLGLHQSNGLCLTEPPPLNTVHSFGLHYNDAYVMEAMEGHDQHFERGMGGHLVHDFVG